MRLLEMAIEPMERVEYVAPAPGGGSVAHQLEITKAIVDTLPKAVGALIATSDLQGRSAVGGRLLGEVVAERLRSLSARGHLPPGDRVAVLLAGDFYCDLKAEKRGGSGDVRPVWEAFGSWCPAVIGVAGNHDLFSERPSEPALQAFRAQPGFHLLDGDVVSLDGLQIGGVSGIVGRSDKPWRRTEPEFLQTVGKVLQSDPDLILMHEGPGDVEGEQPGLPTLLGLFKARKEQVLVIRGHSHWRDPLLAVGSHCQVLNVNSRVMVLSSL